MGRGTPSMGKRHTKSHTYCKRCGHIAFHIQKKTCASCGYPSKKMRRFDGWATKVRQRRGMGTGRMRYLKTLGRRAKNQFRSNRTKPIKRKGQKDE